MVSEPGTYGGLIKATSMQTVEVKAHFEYICMSVNKST